jgi:hypothetical protein
MSAAFTPGPWRACAFSSIVGCPVTAQPDKTKNTFNVCGVAAPVSRDENIANARLIAAAPELYEALELALEHAERHAHHYLGGDSLKRASEELHPARAALAKARGQ